MKGTASAALGPVVLWGRWATCKLTRGIIFESDACIEDSKLDVQVGRLPDVGCLTEVPEEKLER